MHSLVEARSWIEARVDDVYGSRVGKVVDVYFDPDGHEVHWMLVRVGSDEGPLTLVPVHYSIASRAHVWVPITKDLIMRAPQLESGRRGEPRGRARVLLPLRRPAPPRRGASAPLRGHVDGRAERLDRAVPAAGRRRLGPLARGGAPQPGVDRLALEREPVPRQLAEDLVGEPLADVRGRLGPRRIGEEHPRELEARPLARPCPSRIARRGDAAARRRSRRRRRRPGLPPGSGRRRCENQASPCFPQSVQRRLGAEVKERCTWRGRPSEGLRSFLRRTRHPRAPDHPYGGLQRGRSHVRALRTRSGPSRRRLRRASRLRPGRGSGSGSASGG